ncbi:MAG: hypothetical protein J7M38_08725, partial [Armatimonadetes bacterium]|nr:hypothetical protein [Armatimonadota bacterium]
LGGGGEGRGLERLRAAAKLRRLLTAQSKPNTPPLPPILAPQDLTGDFAVDERDLVAFIKAWRAVASGKTPHVNPDVTGDRKVDWQDAEAMLNALLGSL